MPEGVVQGPTNADRVFLDEVAAILETARLSAAGASERAGRAEIKQLAGQIRDEHARQLSALRSLRQEWFGGDVHVAASTPRAIPAGPNFDRQWVAYMIELHQRAIDVATERLENRGDQQGERLARELQANERREQAQLRAVVREGPG